MKRPDLLHYVDQLHRGLEREIDTRSSLAEAELDRRISSLQREATQATIELKQRLDAMNEFRAALSDQYARAVTRTDFDHGVTSLVSKFEALDKVRSERITQIEQALDRQRGRQTAFAAIATVAGALVTLFILIAGHISVH